MINRTLCFFTLLVAGYGSSYSQDRHIIQGSKPSFYLQHTVASKENWYMLGRMYNQRPKDLAEYNKTSIEQTLPVGKVVQIPLDESNFTQSNGREQGEALQPIYHQVQEKEWMFRISQQYNKVPVAQLEKWNGITSDQVKTGMWLIVGHLKVKSDGSTATVTPVNKKQDSGKSNLSPTPVVVVNPTLATNTSPQAGSGASVPSDTKPVPAVAGETTGNNVAAIPVLNTSVAVNHKGGVFRKHFSDDGKSMEGNAGIFKSTSGWGDGKYYALINNIPVGTIVKVSFSSTNKSIYAKVLGQLPEMKESQGLLLRISDAAAAELGAEIGKFYVDVKY
jgi:LysM repeat protein